MSNAVILSPPFGQDVSCDDYVHYGRMATGIRLLGEAIYRRLITTRGSLEDDPFYGFSLIDWIQATVDPSLGDVLALQSQMTGEILKDERIDDCDVQVSTQGSGPGLELDIRITATTSDDTTFTTVLSVANLTVALLDVSLPEAA